MMRAFRVTDGTITLEAIVIGMGTDLLVSVTGGEKPHIGSTSVSVPRPSLADPEKTSATTSTINMTGHKDNAVGDRISARLSAALNTNVVVACGIHIDDIDSAGIDQVLMLAEQLVEKMIEVFKD